MGMNINNRTTGLNFIQVAENAKNKDINNDGKIDSLDVQVALSQEVEKLRTNKAASSEDISKGLIDFRLSALNQSLNIKLSDIENTYEDLYGKSLKEATDSATGRLNLKEGIELSERAFRSASKTTTQTTYNDIPGNIAINAFFKSDILPTYTAESKTVDIEPRSNTEIGGAKVDVLNQPEVKALLKYLSALSPSELKTFQEGFAQDANSNTLPIRTVNFRNPSINTLTENLNAEQKENLQKFLSVVTP